MSQKNFAITPSVSISRSKFRRPSQHKTSFNLGQIVPIYVDADILPGDTVSLDLATLVRMSTPIAPIMDNIFVDYYAFFTPNRILWDDWKKFMGENTSGVGALLPSNIPNYPTLCINGNPGNNYMGLATGCSITTGSLGDYFGLPIGLTGATSTVSTQVHVSALPARAYCLIYNEWFRDQNLISSIPIYTSSNVTSISSLSTALQLDMSLFIAAKESDYFTRALPYAQKGSPVSLPLGSIAPVVGATDLHDLGTYGARFTGSSGTMTGNRQLGAVSGILNAAASSTFTSDTTITKTNLVADLSNATAATINQLRFAFQYQKFLEKDALYGTRYWEILKGHFGITAPDASLQRPELLGHFRQHINIDQVLQTSESGTTALGTTGANSVSGKSEHLISKSFVEHGVLMILAVARHDQTYGQGINRMWSRKKREDFYFPVFANLGAQEIKNKEIYASSSNSDNEGIFGYQEAWAEYRYKPSITTGLMNPAVSGSMSYWNLGNNFGALPTLSKSFIEQDRNNIQRCLVSGSGGPDFIADFFFDATYVRPMPMYSIPGLIDHH